jgi:PEP-CTERM motif
MKSHARFKNLFKCLSVGALVLAANTLAGPKAAQAQQLLVDFRFDGQSAAAATTQTLTAGSAAQTYTIDMWATVVPAAATANTNLGLQGFSVRGASDITVGGGAFSTGATVGTVAGSFGQLSPFNPAGFTQPKVSDLGSTTNGGASITSTTADGILDFGGTLATQKFTSLSNNGGLIFGGGATGQANPNGGWEWEVAQFTFTPGTTSTTSGATTLFMPLQVSVGTSTAGTISTNGSSAVSVPVTSGSPLTFVVGGVVTGNDSVLNMTPAIVPLINSLAGGTTTTNLSVANTAADAATATGAFTGAFSGTSAGASQVITGSPVGTTPGQAAISYLAGGTPSATPVAFSYTITNTSNASDAQGANANKTTAFTVNDGSAIADNTGVATAFGPPLTATVLPGGSYLGLESKVLTPPVAGAGSPAFPAASYTAGTADLAVILAGTNATANGGGSATTVSMAWRTRTAAEAIGGAVFSPSLLKPTTGIVSDVVNLQGVTAGTEAAGGITDPFVLEMAFNPALTPKGGTKLATLIANHLIYMISLNSTTGLWDRATIDENFNNKVGMTDPSYGVNESFSAYLAANPTLFPAGSNTPATVTAAELNNVMGAWGVDTSGATPLVWSVLDHNSQFAVVPEPSTLLLAGLGLLGLVGLRRRMKKSA